MKIAIISTMLGQVWTGSEELWADMAEVALEQGHEVDISLWRWPSVPPRVQKLQKMGARVTFRARRNVFKTLYKMASRRIPLPWPARLSPYRPIFDATPDVICHSQGWVYEFRDNPDLMARFYESKIPLVVVNQANDETPVDEAARLDTQRFFERCARVAFVAAGNLKAAERQLAVAIPHGVVVRNPVNLQDFSAVPWPDQSNQSEIEWQMACVGRLEPSHKAQDVLLEALSDLRWRDRAWKLRFFGGGMEKNYLQALIKHYDLGAHVEFGGHVPDVRAIWEQHHLLVLPSRREGTPLAMVEAMLCGRAALVSDVAGFPEWIEDEKTGFIALSPSAPGIDAALERAWQARDRWQQMGLAARDASLSRYDLNPGQTLLQILLEAAESPSQSNSISFNKTNS